MSTTHRPDDDPVDLFADESTPQQQHVRSLLAGLPDPGPMPEDLVARIHARLADEALGGTTAPEVVDLDSRRRRMRRMGVVAALGGVAAAAGVVGVLMTGGLDALDRSAGNAVADFRASAPATSSAPAAPVVSIVVASTDIPAARLDAEASRLLQATPQTPRPGVAESPVLGPLATPQGLTDCLTTVKAPAYTKVAAELARYEGRPAVVLGLQGTDGQLSSWALDRSCAPLTERRVIS